MDFDRCFSLHREGVGMGRYEEMKKIGQKIFTSWSLAAMFLILLIAAASPAGDVSLKIDGTDQPDPADLAEAIGASNTHANGAGQYATAIEITLTGAQTANSGTANTINPLYFSMVRTTPMIPPMASMASRVSRLSVPGRKSPSASRTPQPTATGCWRSSTSRTPSPSKT